MHSCDVLFARPSGDVGLSNAKVHLRSCTELFEHPKSEPSPLTRVYSPVRVIASMAYYCTAFVAKSIIYAEVGTSRNFKEVYMSSWQT